MPPQTTTPHGSSGGGHATAKSSLRRRLAVTAAALAIAGAIAAGTSLLHWRADAVPAVTPLPPLTVSVQPIRFQPDHEVLQRFVGRIEPARTTPIAFERSGLVTDVAVDEGNRVDKGQVLARLDVEPLAVQRRRLVAERSRVSAQLAFARKTLERRGALAGRAVSRQLFDEVRFEAEALEAQIAAINAGIAAIDVDIAKSTVSAPFAGTIATRSLDHGSVVTAGTEVVRLLETGAMQARIGVPPEVATTLAIGESHRLSVLGRKITGTVVSLRPDLETATRTVVALFDVPDATFAAAGELVELSLMRRVPGAGAWVPVSALSEGEKGLWSVFVVLDGDAGPVLAREAVEIVHTAGQRAFVRGSFAEAAQIVTSGPNRLTPGQPVVVVEG